MRKICIIADAIDTQYAGVLTYASLLIPALEAQKPADVEITYLHQCPHPFFEGRRELLMLNPRHYPGSDTVRRMVYLPRMLRREGFELVHDLGHMAPFPWRNEPYKKIVTVHDLTPILMPEAHVRTSRLTHRFLFPRILKNCDHIITVSQTTKNDVMQFCAPAAPVTAIPLAAKPLDYSRPRPQQQPYILCVSTLEPRKNIDILVRAFEAAKERGLPHDLVLIGKEGWQVDNLLEYMRKSPYKASIHCKGFVPDEVLGAWYAHADVCVYPSAYEGFGLPVLEAEIAGVPIIVADTPAAREIAGDAVRVPVGDVSALQKAIEEVIMHPDIAQSRAATCRLQATNYTWEKTAAATWDVYNSYLS